MHQRDRSSKKCFVSTNFGVDEKSKPEDFVEVEYWDACKDVLEPLQEKSIRYLKCLRLTAEPEIDER